MIKKILILFWYSFLLIFPAFFIGVLVKINSDNNCITCGITISITLWILGVISLQPIIWTNKKLSLSHFLIWLITYITSIVFYLLLEMLSIILLNLDNKEIAISLGFLSNYAAYFFAVFTGYYLIRRFSISGKTTEKSVLIKRNVNKLKIKIISVVLRKENITYVIIAFAFLAILYLPSNYNFYTKKTQEEISHISRYLQNRNGIMYEPNQEKPYTGKYVKVWDGVTTWHDANITTPFQLDFLSMNNDPLIWDTTLYKRKRLEGNFKNGIKDGAWVLYSLSRRLIEGNFKNGIKDGAWVFDSAYNNKRKKIYENGNLVKYIEWNSISGKIYEESNYKNGKLEGVQIAWHENGQKKMEKLYVNEKLNGTSTLWYENGQKEVVTNYKEGKRHGLLTRWYENGKKRSEKNYKEGKLNGLMIFWNENGEVLTKDNFDNGKVVDPE